MSLNELRAYVEHGLGTRSMGPAVSVCRPHPKGSLRTLDCKVSLVPAAVAFSGEKVPEDGYPVKPFATVQASGPETMIGISDDWDIVSFEGRDVSSVPLLLARLQDWSRSDDPKLRCFAGRAVYEKTVECAGKQVTFDLGEVHGIANVYANGRFVDCLWETPYRTTFTHPLPGARGGDF